MSRELDAQQLLAAIERIAGDDFCEDLDMRAATTKRLNPDLRTACEKLGRIYKIAHSFQTAKICYSVHDDWRAETERMVAEALEAALRRCGYKIVRAGAHREAVPNA